MPEFDYDLHYAQWHTESPSHHREMSDYYHQELAKLDIPNRGVGRAIDVGCGRGYLLGVLRDLGYEVEGIDSSDVQVQHSRASGYVVHNTSDLSNFASHVPEQFSLVTMFDLIEHIPVEKQLDFLGAAHQLLVPGGTLIVKTPNAASPAASYMRYVDWTHTSSFTVHSITPLLQSAGFIDISFKADTSPFRFGLLRGPVYFLSRLWWKLMLTSFVGRSVWKIPLEPNLVITCNKPQ